MRIKGTLIQQVIVQANVSLADYGMIRFWIQKAGDGANNWNLIKEVPTGTVQKQSSGQFPLFSRYVYFGNLFLPSGANLGVTSERNDQYQISAFGLDITGWI